MADVYIVQDFNSLLVYLGQRITGGYGISIRKRNAELLPKKSLDFQRLESAVKGNVLKPKIIDEDLADSITFAIEELENGQRCSNALNEKMSLLLRAVQNTRNIN